MSRTKIERRYRKMQADAKAFGAELLTEESIFIDDDHLDCVWYGGHIGGLRYKGYEVSVEVHGDVEIVGFMNGHDFLYKNKQNTGAMNMAASDTLTTTFKSDAELWDALNADEEAENKVAFENNSWIEAFVKDPRDIGTGRASWMTRTTCWTPAEVFLDGSTGSMKTTSRRIRHEQTHHSGGLGGGRGLLQSGTARRHRGRADRQ